MSADDRPTSKPAWLLVLALGVITAGAAVAYFAGTEDFAALAVMRDARRGELSAPRRGRPFIYRGHVNGPDGRETPLGREAAAYWWWVDKSGKNRKTICSEIQRDGLELTHGQTARELSLFASASTPSLCLVSDERDDWVDCRSFIDLGRTPKTVTDTIPQAAAERCSADEYIERYLPSAAEAELLACWDGERLVECSGPLAAVLVAGTIDQHRARRRETALEGLRIAGGIVSVMFIVVSSLLTALSLRRNTAVARAVTGPVEGPSS